jgi:hypothetical protein
MTRSLAPARIRNLLKHLQQALGGPITHSKTLSNPPVQQQPDNLASLNTPFLLRHFSNPSITNN